MLPNICVSIRRCIICGPGWRGWFAMVRWEKGLAKATESVAKGDPIKGVKIVSDIEAFGSVVRCLPKSSLVLFHQLS